MPTSIATNSKRNCSVLNCTRSMKTYKDYCPSHYKKWKKYGDPLVSQREMHGLWSLPEYAVWSGMKSRCYNTNGGDNWEWYGKRGIRVCDKWLHSFKAFYEDMKARPSPKHTIDRIDVNGDYEPNNCRWVVNKVQANNRRNNVLIEFNGVTKNRQEWAEYTGIKYTTIRKRLGMGWSPERTLTTKPLL